MSETEKRKIKVFIASPNDLAEERRKFRSAIDVLNIGFADGANVEFIPLGWEDTLASTGRRSQGVINQDIDSCDVFILTMHRRWGQEAPDAAPYSSYTEEEFHRALERWKKNGKPEIFVFFKRVDAASEADAGPQLSKVIKFRQHLEETRQILYRYFDSPESFFDEVDTHLRAYAKDELPKAEDRDDTVVLPVAALEEVEKAKLLALQKTEEARQANDAAEEARLKTEEAQLEMAEVAAQLAMEGKVEFAREKFTKLVSETTNLRILFLGYEFFSRTDDWVSAFNVIEKWLSLSGPENRSIDTADAIGNFGNLYQERGELDLAEEMHNKALAIYETLGHKRRVAEVYINLGALYHARGEPDRAKEIYTKSLEIYEELGCNEGMADVYSNLANLYAIKEELYKAEEMNLKSLVINELLDRKERLAINYANLAIVYQNQGKLDDAEEIYRKALAIDDVLGRKKGMAINYINLGTLYQYRSQMLLSENMYLKAISISEEFSYIEGSAGAYVNLGTLYETRGELERAEEMYEKAFALFREIQWPNEQLAIAVEQVKGRWESLNR